MRPATLAPWMALACIGARSIVLPGFEVSQVPHFDGNSSQGTCGDRPSGMVVVTGADSHYFFCMKNLVAAINFWEPNMAIAAYDLGLDDQQRADAQSWKNTCLYRSDAVSGKALRVYGWKPIIIREALDKFGEVLWIDGGSSVRGPLKKIQELLRADGHFLVQGQDENMKTYTRNSMFEYYGLKKQLFSAGPSYSGNLQGWVRGSESDLKIFRPTVACALDEKCINGREGGIHRFDQSALSINAYKSGLNITAHTELLAWSKNQLQQFCSVPSSMVVWTSRCGDNEYLKGYDGKRCYERR